MRDPLKRLLSSAGFIVVAAFLVRIAYLHHYFVLYLQPIARDNLQYGAETGAVAAAIASGHGFSSPLSDVAPTGPTAWLAPIFPYLLAGIFKLFGTYSYLSDLMIRTLDCAFSACTVWPVMEIGTRSFGRKSGIAAGWLWVILPSATYYPVVWVWDSALTGLCMALLLAATLRLRGSDQRRAWIGYGVLWGIAALINPSVLSVLPFLALWAVWPLRRHWKRAIELAVLSSAMFFACITPWTVRNYEVFHALLPLRSNFGLELWLGNNAISPTGWATWLHPSNNAEQARDYARMTEIPYMAEKRREAWAFIRAHPGETTSFIFHRFVTTWTDMWGAPVDVWPYLPFHLKCWFVYEVLFSLLAFCGVLFACRAGIDAGTPLASMMIVFPLVFYLTHPDPRYRYPLDPVMLILAVYAVANPLARWTRHSSPIVPRPAEAAAGDAAD